MAQGKPFVGVSRRRLDEALSAARVDRLALFVTNSVLCQLHEDEDQPPADALAACHDRLITEIRQRMPRKVLALGATAAEALTDMTGEEVGELRVRRPASPELDYQTEVHVTYHPAAVHYNRRWAADFDADIRWLTQP